MRIAEHALKLRSKNNKGLHDEITQALDLYGARSRNRTGTPLRAGDFKSGEESIASAARATISGPQNF